MVTGFTLSLISSSMGLLPHSISTSSLTCPGTEQEKGVPRPGPAPAFSHRQMVKAKISVTTDRLILPYMQLVLMGKSNRKAVGLFSFWFPGEMENKFRVMLFICDQQILLSKTFVRLFSICIRNKQVIFFFFLNCSFF